MTAFSSSIIVLCCSLFTASLIKLIAPSGKTEKILKVVISLFVLICLTNCIKTIADEAGAFKDKLVSDNNTSEVLTQTIDENVLKVTADYMVAYVESLLYVENIEYNKINVTVNADEKGVINITDICIYINKRNADVNKTSALIENDLKITPRVILEESE